MKNLILCLSFLGMPFTSFAETGGSEGTGGGDLCEARIYDIRNDIKSWIQKGGHKDLNLSAVNTAQYEALMINALDTAKVQCVVAGDKGYPVQINGTPKECLFIKKKNKSLIICDKVQFENRTESSQYQLIHHEYAGIAGIEKPTADVSDYSVSNQISAFLVDTIVKRLAVKTPPPPTSQLPVVYQWRKLDGAEGIHHTKILIDAFSKARFQNTGCNVSFYGPSAPTSKTQTCGGQSHYYSSAYMRIPSENSFEDALELSSVPIGGFDCNKSESAEEGIFLYQEINGLPIYRHFFKSTMRKGILKEDAKTGDDVEIIYTLNAERSLVENFQIKLFRFYTANAGTAAYPVWVQRESVSRKAICTRNE